MRTVVAILWFCTQVDLVLIGLGGLLVAVLATVSFFDPSVKPDSGDGSSQTTLGWIATVLIALAISAAGCVGLFFAGRARRRPAVKYACIGVVLGGPFVLMRPTVAPFVIIGLMLVLWWWEKRQIAPGHCRKCRYNLTGNVSGTCPECGTPVPIDDGAASSSAESPAPKVLERHGRAGKIVIACLLTWGALALCYVYVPWQSYMPETWLLRLRWVGSDRAMTELLGRFGSGRLAPANAKRFFDELVSVSLEAKRTASDGSVVTVTLHLESAHVGWSTYLQLDELELSVNGQPVPFKWDKSRWSSSRGREEAVLTFRVLGGPAEIHVVTLRATASWHRGVMAGAPRGRPLRSKYGWLIEESAVIETGQ